MEEKINVAEILESKSQGTKLYSLTYGDCFYQEYTGDFGIEYQSQNGVQFNLDEYGKYCIDGKLVKVWDSIVQAKRETGIGHISEVCCGAPHCHTAGGYIWKHVSENSEMEV